MTLNVAQARRLTPAEKSKKVYRPDVLRAVYRHIPNQSVRDIFRVRMSTGLHFTEIARIVRGKAHIREVDAGVIVAVIDVTHKSGQEHRQSVDAPTLAVIRRLMETKTRRRWRGRWRRLPSRRSRSASSSAT